MKNFDSFFNQLFSKHKPTNLFWEYIKHIITIIIIPILLLNVMFVLLIFNSYNNDVKNHIHSIAQKNAITLDNIFYNIDTYYKNCVSDNDITLLLNNSVFINNSVGNFPIVNATEDAKKLNDYLNCIDSVYIYTKKLDYVYGLIGKAPAKFEKFKDKTWYEEYLRRNSSDYVANVSYNNTDYLTFCYNLGNPSYNPGILVIKIPGDRLIKQFDLASSKSEALKLVSNITNDDILKYNNDNGRKKTEYSIELANYPATLVYSVSDRNSHAQRIMKSILFVLIALITLILAVILAFIFSKKQYNSIISVISAIEDPYINDRKEASKLYSIIEKTDYEFPQKNIEDDLLDKITLLKKGQLIALQTQINPHFMYNTLYMISASITEHNKDDTDSIDMIMLLADVLRYALKTEQYIVTVKEETDVSKSYVTILELRHGNSFSVEWNIADEVYSLNTLKSLLQPLIENSLEHGIQLLYGKRRGKITINAYTQNDLLYLNVTDNGVGMPAEKLFELKNILNDDSIFRNENVGLKNVVSRIKLLFGDKAGIDISSDSECTSFTIYHPVIGKIE